MLSRRQEVRTPGSEVLSFATPKTNPNPKHNRESPNPRKPRPGWHRLLEGYHPVLMQAHHVDETTHKQGRPGMNVPWCEKCWLKNPRPGHFCRWDLREGGRDPDPPILWVPLFRWVRDGGSPMA